MYRNTQFGTVIVGALLPTIGFGLWMGSQTSWHMVAVALLALLVAILILFFSLTVEISPNVLRCSFGLGLISRTIPMDRVTEARRVRNRWYYGLGIRRVPGAWMFNVSGLDAVELILKSGKGFRIGTNDPVGLLSAINKAKKGATFYVPPRVKAHE